MKSTSSSDQAILSKILIHTKVSKRLHKFQHLSRKVLQEWRNHGQIGQSGIEFPRRSGWYHRWSDVRFLSVTSQNNDVYSAKE